ncbi:MAG: tripartite tricarboxylate transporter substrate binding protein [Betaproteobacteria bacterium]|nr:tripartite tricarboxylate transporter substrate binding protein [Betaproteobacteria bacterium]
MPGFVRAPWKLPAAALLAITVQPAAVAQSNYPIRPVRIIVPNAPGSSGDIIARLVAPPLSERLGQPVVVDNRAGAGTMIGGEAVAKSPPDGYTLLMGFSTLAINPATYRKVPYDALRDFAPITHAVSLPGILLAHPSLPAKSVRELIALAKARPGDIAFASGGQGSYSHMSSELFSSMAGIRMLHVPYRGSGPGYIDLLAGNVSVMAANILSAIPHVRSGRLRALGITSKKRAASAPDVPTVAEGGLPGYESVQWLGLLAPAGTPREIIARLHQEVAAVLRSQEMKDRLARDGAEPIASSSEEFGAYLRRETEKWAKVAKVAGIRPE